MIKNMLSLTLACLLLCATAQAQEPLRPTDPLAPGADRGANGEAPIRDVGGWLGEEQLPGAPPAAPATEAAPAAPAAEGGATDPLAGPAATAPDAAAPAPAPVDPEQERRDARKRERTINKNYNDALQIYEGMESPDHSINALDRRIANNERLIADFKRRIAEATAQRRAFQVDLFNRTFFLRQQRERGQITQESFDKLIRQEERKYEEETANLKGNLEAWHKELKESVARLESLKSERRMLDASRARAPRRNGRGGQQAGANVPAPKPGERLLGTLEERMRQLDRFNTRSTMEGVHPRDVGVGSSEPRTVDSSEAEDEE